MHIAFVHGINNENNTPQSIEDAWWEALIEGWRAAGLEAKRKPKISVAYYADLLAGTIRTEAVEMGASGVSTGLAPGLLQEYADAAGLTSTEIAAGAAGMGLPQEAVEQGVPHEGWIVNFASLLERLLPTKGKFMARLFLSQAVTYINDRALAARIDKKVASAIFDGHEDPVIVIAHSLGTVVSYRVLGTQSASDRSVPIFLTLGSPLSARMFKSILPTRGTMPKPPIARWFNGRDPEDFVTLGRAISVGSIGFSGVEDCTEIVGDDADKHSVARYLSSPAVARVVHSYL